MKGIICHGFKLAALAWLAVLSAAAQPPSNPPVVANPSAPIPMDQLGAVAGKQYQGDGLSVTATPDGARLRCAFQRLEGEVARNGLWLRSTAGDAQGERFRVMAVAVGRQSSDRSAAVCEAPAAAGSECFMRCGWVCDHSRAPLESTGSVLLNGQTVRFSRPGLTEEYSVSVDGVRQDFIVEQQPAGEGELRVELAVTGARVEPLVNGVRLVLDSSGRKLAYNRLRVVDATGRELPARMEVAAGVSPAVEDGILPPGSGELAMGVSGFNCDEFAGSGLSAGLPVLRSGSATEDGEAPALAQEGMPAAMMIAVVVDDAAAIYPVRIDPTFSDADWISMGVPPGASGDVYAMAVDDFGNLYIGGAFTSVGGSNASRIAKWNGSVWSNLGAGMNNNVEAIVAFGTNLYAGGIFTTAGGAVVSRIAKWDGTAWSALGSGVNSDVYSLVVSGTNLYVGGKFTYATNVGPSVVNVNRVAKWDGSTWSALGLGLSGGVFGSVEALAVSGTNLYAGGSFATANGTAVNNIARWNGIAWSALGSGVNTRIFALAVSGTNLYAGGEFTTAGGMAASRIAKWDGSAWSAMGTGVSGIVYVLTVFGPDLYAGGISGGGVTVNNIARWDGSTWSGLGSGMNGGVLVMAVSGANLYAGGIFITAGGTTVNYVAKWDANMWSALGSGMNNTVNALALSGTGLYAGGTFLTAGGMTANRIVKWDGSVWSTLGAGLNNRVNALAVSGTNLYVGGGFNYATNAGSVAVIVNRVAKWDGHEWSALGTGMDSTVNALAAIGTDIYAGGSFGTAGGTVTGGIAKWDGNSWSAVGAGLDNIVNALAISGTDLYAGGAFTYATNAGQVAVNVNRIAKWDGSVWSALDTGISSTVNALAAVGTVVYAGGSFGMAGGIVTGGIAKWDGSVWSALGLTLNNTVSALAVSGTNLYAGGAFTYATNGGPVAVNVNRIAKWDGGEWSALGSGMNNTVRALATSGTDLYAGGDFIRAGGKVSGYTARANIGAAASPGLFSNLVYSPNTGFTCTFSDGTVGQPYRIQTSPSLAVGPWTDLTNFIYASPIVITDVSAVAATNTFYRAVTP